MEDKLVFLVFGSVLVIVSFVLSFLFIKPNVQNFGATPGANFNFPCETHNGIQTCYYNVAMSTGTTTVCSLRSPSATSTISRAPIMSGVGSTTAATWTIAKGATTNASTTLIASASVGANVGQVTLLASTTAVGLDSINVVAPNTFLNFSESGGNGTFSGSGRCIAEFESVNAENR